MEYKETKHPAVYSDTLLPVIMEAISSAQDRSGEYKNITLLDPFAGTGKIGQLREFGFDGKIICNEMEEEWAISCDYDIDEWHIGDAAYMPWASDNSIDIIVTSPTYSNRMADHYNAKDDSKRRTYRTFLGHDLNVENTGRMQWGNKYRDKHIQVWKECYRVLQKKGIFVLNISDHIRKGEVIKVTDWHVNTLWEVGFILEEYYEIPTKRYKFGQNQEARVKYESVIRMRKT